MGHLSKPFVGVLSQYVFGMVMLRHSGQSQIANFLSQLGDEKVGSVRQRLRELTYESGQKRGKKRRELEVKASFAPLLRWIVSRFKNAQHQLVLALDVTYLSNRLRVLSVSVLVGGVGIPVAWRIQENATKGSWNAIWVDLLEAIAAAVPSGWRVAVLTDSGLYTKTLFKKIVDYGWIPLMRIEVGQALFKPEGSSQMVPLSQLVHKGMPPLHLRGICFRGDPLPCTVSLQWEADYDKPCAIVTSLPPHTLEPALYGLRYWIERGFKSFKRGFFHWEHSKIKCPQRAERLWLVMSIALLWLVAVGEETLDTLAYGSSRRGQRQKRTLSALVQGWSSLIARALRGEPFSFGSLPDYLVSVPDPPNTYP